MNNTCSSPGSHMQRSIAALDVDLQKNGTETQCSYVYVVIFSNNTYLHAILGGTGEYTTGWTGSGASQSDKKAKYMIRFYSVEFEPIL